ncbi:MAG TPA: hypothetical protein DD671_01755, partial [Balneolaceae bacterium]|nr:hypothetical protein [Balneolaceae bacterium]|tara:strand:- start:171 stop:659 length:489 start_codon:yes stop_codon:yes gene_type:complete
MRIAGLDSDIQQNMSPEQSSESQLVKVPFLKGMTPSQAKEILSQLTLHHDIKGKAGYVISQEPEAGTEILPGQEISLTLSETYAIADSASVKEGYAEVPDLIGMNMRKAHNLLLDSGLKTELIGSGTVFAQYPKAGASLRKGYTVTVRGKGRSLELISKLED